jgi:hypothetical protein
VVAAGVARLLAIEHDELPGRRRAAHLGLERERDALELGGRDLGVEPAEGGLARRSCSRRSNDASAGAFARSGTGGTPADVRRAP